MTTLAELVERDNVKAHWFWTHEVSTGPYTEYEVWDAVFVRDTHEPQLWVTDGETRRTLYVQDIGGSQADSRRATGGERREPDTLRELANVLSAAAEVDEFDTFLSWSTNRQEIGDTRAAWELVTEYEIILGRRNALRDWLGEQYDEYMKAAAEE